MSITERVKKVATVVVAVGMLALTVAPSGANAQTVADLQAQINALLAQIAQLQAQLAAQTGGSVSCNFTRNLFLGVSGADVQCLQRYLNGAGFTLAASGAGSPGSETQFYGPLTQAAVAAWQGANGVAPAVGYFGPISRAKYNALIAVAPAPGAPVTGPVSNVCAGSTAEGTFTATKAPSPGDGENVREGDTQKPVLGIDIETTSAPVRIQRVKLDVGTTTTQWKKVFSRVHVMDGSTVLASMDLKDSTVSKEGSNYFVTITGFDFGVPVDTEKTLTIGADLLASIDAADQHDWDFGVPVDGVRGRDCSGVDTFGPSTAISGQTASVLGSLAEEANLILATGPNTPDTQEVMSTEGSSNNDLDRATLLHFTLRAEDDDIKVTDITLEVDKDNGGGATASTTVWLVEGEASSGSGTVIGSASVTSNDTAVLNDVDFVVPKNTTKTYTVQADIDNANINAAGFIARASSSGITAESVVEGSLSSSNITGSATGEEIFTRNEGPEVSLVSRSIAKTISPEQSNISTSTAKGTFTIRIKAVGAAIEFGDNASASPFFGTSTSPIYRNAVRGNENVASSTDFTVPSGVTTSGIGSNSFQVSENNTVDVTVDFWFEGRTVAGALVTSGSYSIGVEELLWYSADTAAQQTTNFMASEAEWRTSSVSLP